jgi:Cellulase (glycosyl hydrolase family 5)
MVEFHCKRARWLSAAHVQGEMLSNDGFVQCSLPLGKEKSMKGKERFQLLTLLITTPLIFTIVPGITLWSTTGAQAASQTRNTSSSALHIAGNQIANVANLTLTAHHGVDRMGGEYSCPYGNTFDGPVDQASVTAMRSWKVSIVRLPMNEDCWLGINGYPAGGLTATQYRQAFVNYVNLLNQNGITVILDLHWNNSGTNKATGQEPMPDRDHAPAFWTSVANTFKSNSSVMFDLYNEPYTTSWSCWKNGSTAANASPCTDVGFAVAGMQTLVNTVRATGATNIIMLGGLAYSNDLSQWLTYKPSDPLGKLVASAHIYNFNTCNNTSCWNAQIAPVAAKVPVIVGELGENDCASGFISTLMSWLDAHKIGYLAWTWNPYNCSSTPSLITSYTGTPTNYGLGYKNHLLTLGG